MKTRFTGITARCVVIMLIALGGLAIAGTGLGQPIDPQAGNVTMPGDVAGVGDIVPVEEPPGVVEQLILSWLPLLVTACAALTACFPSTNKLMRIIDVFAFSWGKARNDPKAQKWGTAAKL